MLEFEMVFWYWWVLAIVFLAVEIFAPGSFFLWMAMSGVVTGSVLLLAPFISLEIQLLIFSVLSFASILIWRRYFGFKQQDTDQPLLNKKGAQYIGRTYTLIEPITNGEGKIKVGDTLWKVQGDDCPVDAKVKVVDVNSTILIVTPIIDEN